MVFHTNGLEGDRGATTSAPHPFQTAAQTLLSALENLMLIDEHGHSRTQTALSVRGDALFHSVKRRPSEKTPRQTDDEMDIDETEKESDRSPLKRKRDASAFPLPDAKSHRISAALSSRLQQSLRVAEGTDDPLLPTPIEPTDPSRLNFPRRTTSRRPSRPPRNDSVTSVDTDMHSTDLIRDMSASSLNSPVSPVFGLSRGSSYAELADPISITAWIECQARRNHMSVPKMQDAWNEKRKELEYNLTLLANGVPSDSYQDLKSITEKIMESANWLSVGNLDELGDLVPLWRMMEPNIDNVVHYIHIVEDMKSTIQTSFHMTGSLPTDLTRMRTCLDEKKHLWGTTVSDDASAWRVLGFPVDELRGVLAAAAAWMYGLAWACFVQIDNEVNRVDRTDGIQSLMDPIFSALLFAKECAEFIQKPFYPRVLIAAYTLTTLYTTYTLTTFSQLLQRSNKPRTEVRVLHLFGNLARILDGIHLMRGPPIEDPALDSLARSTVEAGLQLCEYVAARNCVEGVAGRHVLLVDLVCRFVGAVVRMGKSEGDEERLKRLLGRVPVESG
ncbi:hypothetical protein SpCBS45565_g08173 [Spizellomyces sp. 'palustris']|nr:hypothetical protein SpCBS45565_g08173 [Spizellomyces sp. 'palustris']